MKFLANPIPYGGGLSESPMLKGMTKTSFEGFTRDTRIGYLLQNELPLMILRVKHKEIN